MSAFGRKHDIFTCENNKLSSRVKRSPLLWLHDKSRLSKQKNIKVKWFGISLMFILSLGGGLPYETDGDARRLA